MNDFEIWQDTGRFMPRQAFMTSNPEIILLGACDDVVLYDGGYYIQVLFDGTFYESNTNRSKKLDDVEMNLFLEKVMQKID
jgi:hypothetical protein